MRHRFAPLSPARRSYVRVVVVRVTWVSDGRRWYHLYISATPCTPVILSLRLSSCKGNRTNWTCSLYWLQKMTLWKTNYFSRNDSSFCVIQYFEMMGVKYLRSRYRYGKYDDNSYCKYKLNHSWGVCDSRTLSVYYSHLVAPVSHFLLHPWSSLCVATTQLYTILT